MEENDNSYDCKSKISSKKTLTDLMHKSWSEPCFLGHKNLRIVSGRSLQAMTSNIAQISVS